MRLQETSIILHVCLTPALSTVCFYNEYQSTTLLSNINKHLGPVGFCGIEDLLGDFMFGLSNQMLRWL